MQGELNVACQPFHDYKFKMIRGISQRRPGRKLLFAPVPATHKTHSGAITIQLPLYTRKHRYICTPSIYYYSLILKQDAYLRAFRWRCSSVHCSRRSSWHSPNKICRRIRR